MSWPRLEGWYGMTKYPEAAKGSGYRRNALNCKDVRKARRAEKRQGESKGAKAEERERRMAGRAKRHYRLDAGDMFCMLCVAAASVFYLAIMVR